MTKLFRCLITVSAMAGILQAEVSNPPLRPLTPFTPRGGLPHFLGKLQANQSVRVAYLGGSITEQKGWRVQSLAWLQRQFPLATIDEISAAIGGTGSELGVFRLEKDVLEAKPDLLFVEFAVNDAQRNPDDIRRAMEGIVRKTLKAFPECDICFVYTVTAQDAAILEAGKMTATQSVMEEVADYYNIPSVSLGYEVIRLLREGKLVMSSPDAHVEQVAGEELNQSLDGKDTKGPILFSKEGVHPYLDTGHVLYTQALIRFFTALPNSSPATQSTLRPALIADNWETAKSLPLEGNTTFGGLAVKLDPSTDPLAKQFSQRLPVLWKMNPEATLKFRFHGTKASIYGLISPDGAQLEVSVDGQVSRSVSFDSYCTYPRLALFPIAQSLPDKEHEVMIRVLPDALDKRSILLEARRKDFDEKPDKYRGNCWYLGALLLVGDPVR